MPLVSQQKLMERRIRQLEDRISFLEKKYSAAGRSRADLAAEIEQRLAALEQKYDNWNGPTAFRVYWKNGLRLDTMDKTFRLKIGGRIQSDWAWFCDKDDTFGELEDGVEFRRVRLYIAGQVYNDVEFKAQYDFAGGDADFKDVYIGLRHLPVVGHFRAGHFKEPFGLEELTSSKYITFMERALPNVFAPGRNDGFTIFDTAFDQRVTWAVGVFKETDDFGGVNSDGDYSYTGRLTWLPWYKEDGRKLLHLGIAYSHRSPNERILRFRQRPEAHHAPRFVDTGEFEARRSDLLGVEAAWVHGPFSLQGEYMQAIVDAANAGDACFEGLYVQAGYFLTGEHRVYKRSAGAFDRVKPKKNFIWGGEEGRRGPGAWEVAGRYSYLDLNDGGIEGGRLNDLILGVNWYLNPNTRIVWNYVHADVDDGGDADIFQTRFQIDF